MRFLALACDYDGTLATNGQVDATTITALERLLASGRRLLLVTGRELEDLVSVFPRLDLFACVIAENGALLYRPSTREETLLADTPPQEFIATLSERDVPLSVGRVIVATFEPHETTVLEVIRDLGLELQVIFNKGAVMVLPSGVNKATGLAAALEELKLSAHNVVGVGDAENDHAFLQLCECSVAVANALPAVMDHADFVTRADHSAGVRELIDEILKDDLRSLAGKLTRHYINVGSRPCGEEVRIPPYGINLLVAGSSGGGKSTFATGLLERFSEGGYQFCVIDPEGDYEDPDNALMLGDSHDAPSVDEVLQVLDDPARSVAVNLVGLPLEERPRFFGALISRLQDLRARTGRPHWIVLDETHHVLSADWEPAEITLAQGFTSIVFITVHPQSVAPAVLKSVDVVIALGKDPAGMLDEFAECVAESLPASDSLETSSGPALLWQRYTGDAPFRFLPEESRDERRRHRRKYAEGDLGERSFYFRGAQGELNLRAQNLIVFSQVAEGVDDATWVYHLRNGDYSRWFREVLKNPDLAAEIARIEQSEKLSPGESRAQIKNIIEQHYTLPSSAGASGSDNTI